MEPNTITQVVQTLVWPVTIIVIVIILRDAIRRLIPGLNKLRYKDFELEFNKQVSNVRAELEHAGDGEIFERDTVEVSDNYYESIAEVSPRAAILEAWIGFETTAVSSARVLDLLPQGVVVSARELMVALRKGELIFSDEAKSITKLRTLRNEVVHGYQVKISKESAVEYAWLLRDIAEEIASRTYERLPKNC